MTQAENVCMIPEAGGFSDLRVHSCTGTKEARVKILLISGKRLSKTVRVAVRLFLEYTV